MSVLDTLQTVVSAAGGGGVIGVIGTRVFDWGRGRADTNKVKSEGVKIDADAAKVIAETAVSLVAPLRAQIDDLSVRVDVAIRHIVELRAFIATHIPEKIPPPPIPVELGL